MTDQVNGEHAVSPEELAVGGTFDPSQLPRFGHAYAALAAIDAALPGMFDAAAALLRRPSRLAALADEIEAAQSRRATRMGTADG